LLYSTSDPFYTPKQIHSEQQKIGERTTQARTNKKRIGDRKKPEASFYVSLDTSQPGRDPKRRKIERKHQDPHHE
jgi:hypothetical protein